MPCSKQNCFQHQQAGRSIIELMIAIAIGLMISTILINFYISSRSIYRTVDDNQILEESGRIMLSVLSQQIRFAGYIKSIDDQNTYDVSKVPVLTKILTCEGQGKLTGTNCDNAASNPTASPRLGSDFLQISYQEPFDPTGDNTGSALDCNGQRTKDSNGIITNQYYVNTNRSLVCDGSGNPGATQPFVENVEDFQIQFGIDETGDGITDMVLNPNQFTDTSKIRTINLCLILKGANKNTAVTSHISWSGCNDAPQTANDGVPRMRFLSTIALRN